MTVARIGNMVAPRGWGPHIACVRDARRQSFEFDAPFLFFGNKSVRTAKDHSCRPKTPTLVSNTWRGCLRIYLRRFHPISSNHNIALPLILTKLKTEGVFGAAWRSALKLAAVKIMLSTSRNERDLRDLMKRAIKTITESERREV